MVSGGCVLETASSVTAVSARPARAHARGLVWRTTTDDEPALERPLTREQYRARVETIWRPYHDALRALLERRIAVLDGACPILTSNIIRDGLDAGLLFSGIGTKGRLEDCDIYENICSGLEVRDSADPVVTENKIHLKTSS